MRFGICGDALWAAMRLLDEGEEVLLYHPPPPAHPYQDPHLKLVGRGMVPITENWFEFVAWLRAAPSVAVFDRNGNGKRGDELRARGIPTIGGSPYCDKLEGERGYAMDLAAKCGVPVPTFHPFGSISQAIAWVESQAPDAEFFFKTDRDLGPSMTAGGPQERLLARMRHVRSKHGDRIKHILQDKVEGYDISTAGWWNGKAFLEPWEGTVERKEWGNDDTGPKTGCATNAVWYYDEEPEIVRELHFDKLAEVLAREGAPPGLYDINAQLSKEDGLPYFLEYSPRFGFDATPLAQRLLTIPLGEFYHRLATATLDRAPFTTEEAAFSIRLAVPPFPYEIPDDTVPKEKSPLGLPLLGIDGNYGERRDLFFIAYSSMADGEGGYLLADPAGIVGLSSQVGTDLEEMSDACVEYCKEELGIADLGYRTDGGKSLKGHLEKIAALGYETGPAVLS